MNRGSRSRGNRGARRGPSVARRIATLRRDIQGHATQPRRQGPNKVNLRPYYPLTVQFDMPTPGVTEYFTPAYIISRLMAQLGIASQTKNNIVIKLRSIRAWAYQYGPDTDRVDVNGDISALTPALSDPQKAGEAPLVAYPVIYKFQDFGNIDEPASGGFVWPLSMQQIPLYSSTDFVAAAVVANTKNATVQINLEWSTAEIQPQPPVPALDDCAEILSNSKSWESLRIGSQSTAPPFGLCGGQT